MSDTQFQDYISTEQPDKPVTRKKQGLWDLLSTMRFAIWILIALGVMSLVSMFVGELLPKEAMQKPGMDLGRALIALFQMHDPFRSWWYRLLLGTLCLSLLACILERTPIIWRLWTKKPPEDAGWLKNIRYGIVRTVSAPRADVEKHLSAGGFHWRLKRSDLWIGEHGRIGMWGPLATHTGMLLIGVGALIGSFGGLTTRAGGFSGEVIDGTSPNPTKHVEGLPYAVRIDSFRIQYYPLQPGQLVLVENEWVGRLVRQQPDGSWLIEQRTNDGGTISVSAPPSEIRNQFNNDMDRANIKRFSSWVTVIENGQEVEKREIAVNTPLRRAGYRFYQSSYDPDNPRFAAGYQSVTVLLSDSLAGRNDSLVLKPGVETAVPGDSLKVTASDLLPHFKLGKSGAYSESAEFVNPAVRLTFTGPGGFKKSTWAFLKFPSMDRGPGRYNYKLASLHGEYAASELETIFEVKRTNGGWILWAGFILCSLGLVLCFYVSHRVLYVEWPSGPQGETRLTGLGRKTVHLYARQIDHLLEGIDSQAAR